MNIAHTKARLNSRMPPVPHKKRLVVFGTSKAFSQKQIALYNLRAWSVTFKRLKTLVTGIDVN